MKKTNDPIKKTILDWFLNDRDFESGKKIFLKHGASMSFKNILNRGGNSKDNYKFLCYELARMAGISEGRYKAMLKVPLNKVAEEKEPANVPIDYNKLSTEEIIKSIEFVDPSKLDYHLLKSVIKELNIETENKKSATLQEAFNQARAKKLSTVVPDKIKRSIKLREEFPFLASKECPAELKVLVSDMLTAYENYVKGHEELINATEPQIIADLSKEVVEDYLENRSIWEELNHFKNEGKILGEHPLFAWITREKEIRALSNAELIKLRDQLKNNIPRTEKLIKDEPEHSQFGARVARLEQFKKELELVKSLLELNE